MRTWKTPNMDIFHTVQETILIPYDRFHPLKNI